MEGLKLGLIPFGTAICAALPRKSPLPLVLSLGIGIAAAAGKGDSGLSGFGIVTLAPLFPIVRVLLLLFYVTSSLTKVEIIVAAADHTAIHTEPITVPLVLAMEIGFGNATFALL